MFELTAAVIVGHVAIAQAVEAEQSTATTPFDLFLQYGVLGLVVVGFVTGWIVPGYHQKQLLEENKRLTALVEGKLFPMIETTGTTLEKASGAMERTSVAMEKATAAFERALDLQQYENGRRVPGAGT